MGQSAGQQRLLRIRFGVAHEQHGDVAVGHADDYGIVVGIVVFLADGREYLDIDGAVQLYARPRLRLYCVDALFIDGVEQLFKAL